MSEVILKAVWHPAAINPSHGSRVDGTSWKIYIMWPVEARRGTIMDFTSREREKSEAAFEDEPCVLLYGLVASQVECS